MNLDTDLLRSFLAIVDAGSFTRAAAKVGRTQSAISMQMKRLEEMVGKPLFVRDGRRVQLTADGETLVGYARRMIELNDRALARFAEPGLWGRVRLGIPDDYLARFLPRVLADFSCQHPGVELEVRTEPSVSLDAALAAGELDLTLISSDSVEKPGEPIHREPMVWVTSASHLVHEQSPLPLATQAPHCQMRRNALAALDALGREYRLAYTSHSYLGLQSFVLAGLAVAPIAESSVVPRMRVLTEADGFPPLLSVEVGLKRAAGAVSEATEQLADAIAESLRHSALLGPASARRTAAA